MKQRYILKEIIRQHSMVKRKIIDEPEKRTGTCLQDCFWWLMRNQEKSRYQIIHAIVERKSDGLRHPHSVIYDKKIKEIINIKPFGYINFMLWITFFNVSKLKIYDFDEINSLVLKYGGITFFKHPDYNCYRTSKPQQDIINS